jgi:hypothetical protein
LTASAQWTLGSSASSAPYVKGTGPGGINIPSTVTNLSSGNTVATLPATTATQAFPNQTNYYNPFTIQWQISFNGGSTWQDAGTSENPIYVCLQGPVSGAPIPYRTVVHLACSNDGATTTYQAAQNTWALFAGPANVCKVDGTPLYYYQPGTSFDITENPITVSGLLSIGTSECVGWAHLLQDAWSLNGASSDYNIASPTDGYVYFWVKNWGALPTSGIFYFQSTAIDMIPYPSGGAYGYYDYPPGTNFKNEPSVPGQNSGPNAPSEKVFGNHQFLKYNGTYYDPSYGLTYADATDFQAQAIAGFGKNTSSTPPLYKAVTFDMVTSTVHIGFSV